MKSGSGCKMPKSNHENWSLSRRNKGGGVCSLNGGGTVACKSSVREYTRALYANEGIPRNHGTMSDRTRNTGLQP